MGRYQEETAVAAGLGESLWSIITKASDQGLRGIQQAFFLNDNFTWRELPRITSGKVEKQRSGAEQSIFRHLFTAEGHLPTNEL